MKGRIISIYNLVLVILMGTLGFSLSCKKEPPRPYPPGPVPMYGVITATAKIKAIDSASKQQLPRESSPSIKIPKTGLP